LLRLYKSGRTRSIIGGEGKKEKRGRGGEKKKAGGQTIPPRLQHIQYITGAENSGRSSHERSRERKISFACPPNRQCRHEEKNIQKKNYGMEAGLFSQIKRGPSADSRGGGGGGSLAAVRRRTVTRKKKRWMGSVPCLDGKEEEGEKKRRRSWLVCSSYPLSRRDEK